MLSQKQLNAIEALLSTDNQSQASEKCGVPQPTLSKWIRLDEKFKRELHKARLALFRESLGHVTADLITMLHIIRDEAENEDNTSKDRVQAADKYIGRVLEVTAFLQTQETIERLEQQLQSDGTPVTQRAAPTTGEADEGEVLAPCD